MRAIVYQKYGSPEVLRLTEVERPNPSDDEVLIRVRAASVNPYDWHLLTGLPYVARLQFGLLKPKVNAPGVDVAGQVEAVGKNVTRFRPGDEGFGAVEAGAFADYVCAAEDLVVPKPAKLSFEAAAAVPAAGLTALQVLRDQGRIEPGQRVLINGASGGVGTFAVQVAKALGAEVTGVCSTRNVDLVRSLGADSVTDYTREDFTRSGQRYGLILDNVGNRLLSDCRRVLSPKGVYVSSFGRPENRWLGPFAQLFKMAVSSPFVRHSLRSFETAPNGADLQFLKELLEAGKITPIIDRTYPLSEVPDALRYLEEGHARGKVVISV
jgi:NADPH:quinone reductase-like Zn-dependent oxidoreductase